MKRRLFIGIGLDEHVRMLARTVRERNNLASARWTAQENLHVTVLFLGDVEEEKIPALGAAIREAAATVRPFRLHLKNIHAVPRNRPRMIWAEFAYADFFVLLMRRMIDATRPYREGDYFNARVIPHATIARFAEPYTRELRLKVPDAEYMYEARECALYASELLPDGPRYTMLDTYALGK